MDRFVDLDVVGALESSDKSSSYHLGWDYLRHYEAFFAEYRDAPINILEIGVFAGASLRLWRWFFAQAQITGIDIDESCRKQAGPRITVDIGSQVDPEFLDRVCARAQPSIIIDDGSHLDEHMIATFEHLMPKLAPGGIYIVEDIVHRTRRDGDARANASLYFLDSALACLASRQAILMHTIPAALLAMVDRVSFVRGAVCLHKRDPERDTGRATATAQAYLAEHPITPAMAINYAEWLCANDAAPACAEAALRAVPSDRRASLRGQLIEADTLARAGRIEEARAIIAAIDARTLRQPPLLLHLGRLHMRLGDPEAARATWKIAQSLGMSQNIRGKWQSLLEEG